MALTALDPITALVIIDLQKGIVAYPTAHPIDGVIERSGALADAFRARNLPVVLVNVTGGAPGRTERPRLDMSALPADFAELVPQLDRQPDDIVVTKRTWGAFAGTDLEARLKALGVTQVVVTGVATGTGVEATARQAYEQGFNVTLATDAMTDMRPEAHDYSIRNVFPRLGETGLAADIIALLERRA
ncbi:isochorismatase family protein [Sphingomonas sp. ERG5]|uniref:isochorismatase family protein n=1 Tax=Sphingomonas sp. ERG5 TaxID=1381597 RepID=UPI00054B5691|nr:isochorismatase family protein [Sphingomonas sp. ERG5]